MKREKVKELALKLRSTIEKCEKRNKLMEDEFGVDWSDSFISHISADMSGELGMLYNKDKMTADEEESFCKDTWTLEITPEQFYEKWETFIRDEQDTDYILPKFKPFVDKEELKTYVIELIHDNGASKDNATLVCQGTDEDEAKKLAKKAIEKSSEDVVTFTSVIEMESSDILIKY